MGFYSSSSIVRDFRDHGGEVRPVDVNKSDWDHTLEPAGKKESANAFPFALRLGFRQIGSFRQETAHQIMEVRGSGFDSIRDLYFRTRIEMGALQRLAHADAFGTMALDRRRALWAIKGLSGTFNKPNAVEDLPLFAVAAAPEEERGAPVHTEEAVDLPALAPGEQVVDDYDALRLSLKAHPVSFLRGKLSRRGAVTAAALRDHPAERMVEVAGLVLVRQRPGTASGVIFMTLEDETGVANIIVWPKVFENFRRTVIGARMISVRGVLQKEQGVIHVIAHRLSDMTAVLMSELSAAPAREMIPPPPDPAHHPRNVRVLPKGRNFH